MEIHLDLVSYLWIITVLSLSQKSKLMFKESTIQSQIYFKQGASWFRDHILHKGWINPLKPQSSLTLNKWSTFPDWIFIFSSYKMRRMSIKITTKEGHAAIAAGRVANLFHKNKVKLSKIAYNYLGFGDWLKAEKNWEAFILRKIASAYKNIDVYSILAFPNSFGKNQSLGN